MKRDNRTSGIDIIGDIPWGTHFCQFYQTKEDLMDIIIPYFKAGLENNEFCLWVISDQLYEEEARKALKVAIPEIDAYIKNGQIEIVPYTYWHVEEGALGPKMVLNQLIEKTNKALVSGYDGLRYSGNDFCGHEELLGSDIGKYPVMALCTYSLDMCSSIDIIEIAANHQFALGKKKGKWEKIESSSQKNNKECKQVEAALSMSEEGFCALTTASSEMVYRVSPDWSEMRYFYGRGFLANTESPNPTWLHEYVLPEDQWRVTAIINEAIRTKSTYQTEHRVRLADGSVGWIFSRAVPMLDANGEIVEWFGAASDITKRKEAEAKLKDTLENLDKLVKERTSELEKAYNSLRESEKGLAEAQKMAHIGNWEWDISTDKAYWSGELFRIFGRDPQKLAPTINEFYNYVHPDDRHDIVNLDNKALNEKSSLCKELKILSDDGEERRVHMQSEIIFDEKNVPIRIKGVVQDITERKRTEERVQSLANVVESSQDAIVTVSLDGIVSSWNKGAEQVYGYSAEEVLRKDVSILAPDNLKDEPKKLIDRVKNGIKIKKYETSRLKKDGTLIIVSITLSPVFDIHGKLTDISAIYRDITERKRVEEKLRESEEKYRNIVETANEGIGIIDSELKLTYVNKKLEEMIGYSSEEIIGKNIWDFLSEESKPLVRSIMERGLEDFENPELKYIRKDGSTIWAQVNAKAIFDNNGKFMGIMTMLSDITKRKEAEETLANIEIARKKEIHHRIKNNLQVISSLLDLQSEQFRKREDIRDSEVLEAFRESQDRVISMALIHEELYKGDETNTLNFSTYIRELAENLLQTYSLSSKNIHLKMDLEDNLLFDMDTAVPLGMIVNELISNSLKHAFIGRDRGEIKIKLHKEESTELEKEDREIISTNFILTISDNGVGIPENLNIEDLDSLGMQLVASLVDQLDGELELRRNNGTEFTIKFKVTENK